MDSATAKEMLGDVGDVQRRVKGDRRATSVPLIVFGSITLIAAVIQPMVDWAGTLALLLAPVGFLSVALIYRRREIAFGLGGRERAYTVAAISTLLLLPILGLALGSYALVGIALIIIAMLQRNLQLAIWALVFGVVGGLEHLSLISNRLYSLTDTLGIYRSNDGYFSWSSSLVFGILGLALIVGGLLAQHAERGSGG
jgi:tellurite resistance protein TehA-like permease